MYMYVYAYLQIHLPLKNRKRAKERDYFNPYAAAGQFGQYKMMLRNMKNDCNPYTSESTPRELLNE